MSPPTASARPRNVKPLGGDFWRFLIAAGASNLGDGIRLGALPLLALSLTDDERLIGLTTAATLLPWLLFGPVGGALVDRWDRRGLMIIGQLGRAIAAVILVALILTDTVSIWSVIAIAFIFGIGEVLVDSSSQAAVPQLVDTDQLERANGRLITVTTVFDHVVGFALGAVLFTVAASLPFAIDAITFVVGAMILVTIRRPLQGKRQRSTSLRTDVAEGARFLAGHQLLRGLTAAAATSNFAAHVSSGVLVVLIVTELGASEEAFGFIVAIGAAGGLVGSLVAASFTTRFGRRFVLLAAPLVASFTYVANALATVAWIPAVTAFVGTFAIICFNVPALSLRQEVTPEPLLGRVVATFRMIGVGAAPLGAIAGGFIANATDAGAANGVAAAVQFAAFLILVVAVRHLPASPQQVAADVVPEPSGERE